MSIPTQPSWWATKFRDFPLLRLAPLRDDTDVFGTDWSEGGM